MTKLWKRFGIIGYFVLCIWGKILPQNLDFTHITSRDGLSNSNISCIARDEVGFIWIGTENGLNCYNGYTFRVYRFNPADSTTIASNSILSICSDSKGNLWIGSIGGISRYIKEFDRFVNYNLLGESFPSGITINDIEEDAEGTLWLGTSRGLFRYYKEKDEFKPVFQHEIVFNKAKEAYQLGIQQGIPRQILDKVYSIHSVLFRNRSEFRDTLKYYLGSIDYQIYYNHVERLFITEDSDIFQINDISTIKSETPDILWLGYSNGNILKYYPEKSTCSMVYMNTEMLPDRQIISIYNDENYMWIGTLVSAYIFDKKKEMFVEPKSVLKNIFSKKSIRFYDAGNHKLWITTDDGLVLYDKMKETSVVYKNDPIDHGTLSSNFIRGFLQDDQDNIWVGCRFEGVDMSVQKKQFHTFANLHINGRFNTNMVTAVHVDASGNIWTGYYTGGIDIVSKKGTIIKSLFDTNNCTNCLGIGTVFTLFEDHSGNMWIGTNKGGLQNYDYHKNLFRNYRFSATNPHSIANNDVRNMLEDENGDLWINTFGKGLNYFHPADDKFTRLNTSIAKINIGSNWITGFDRNSDGQILIGFNNGLQKFDANTGKFDDIISDTLRHRYKLWGINCFYNDSHNILWIGTTNGLYLYDWSENHLKNITKEQGLSDNTIKSIIEDNKGNIWIGSNYGLSKINRKNLIKGEIVISNYFTNDGLPSNNFQPSACFRDKNGILYFGTSSGLVFFDPEEIVTNPDKPKVLITGITLFEETLIPGESQYLDKSVSYTEKVILPHNQNFITLQFVALNYVQGYKNQYAYYMKGIDKNWVYAGNQREANYKNLAPGEYIFYVKASNNDGVWNENPAKLTIIIKPPLWLTTIAKIFYILIVMAIIIFFMQRLLAKERAKRERELMKAENDKKIEINNLKIRFFTNIAHEFRTPLTLITAPLENILNYTSDERVRSQAKLIQKNTQRLLRLVNQLMSLRRVQTGHLVLQAKEDEMISFVKDIFNTFLYQADKKEIKYHFTAEVKELKTWFDQDKLDKILYNLISNAFKNTPVKGSIWIGISTVSANEKPDLKTKLNSRETSGFVRIDIKDSGKGIPKESMDNIFTRFYSTDSMDGNGTGIGLAITKELVELHHGYIEVESEEGKGTLFSVYIPLGIGYLTKTEIAQKDEYKKTVSAEHSEETNQKSQKAKINTYEFRDNEKRSILIVEDDEEVGQFLKSELKHDFNIYEANNGKTAFELALQYNPDIIISDIMMPEMDGIELCKKLKNDEHTNHIPVILLTARVNEESRLEGFEVGADAYIEKPFSSKLLKARITNLLLTRQRMREKFSTFSLNKSTPITGNPTDEKFLRKAIKVIEENISDSNFSINQLCLEVGLSRSVLYSKIRSITDLSVNEFIRAIRLKKAVQYFQDGYTSVSDVAFMVGFKTLPHFSRCFSNEFNLSPSEYITKIRD